MKYLRRVSSEIQAIQVGPDEEELVLQGVRFAFRVHQVKTTRHLLMYVVDMLSSPSSLYSLLHVVVLSPIPFVAVRRRFRRRYDARLSGVEGDGVSLSAVGRPKPTPASAKARWQKLRRMYL